jgi:hypothetical protein
MAKPKYDFPAVSCGKKPPEDEWDEDLYEYITGKDWKKCEKGEKIGWVKLKQSKKGEKKVVTTTFHFEGSAARRYEGPVPGDGTWEGESTLTFVGRGDHKGRPTINVISTNPKRWG